MIDGDVVGTVGLSGSPDKVEQFGLVVKRQTEILMQEAERIGSRRTRERSIEELLRDIVEWHRSTLGVQPIERRARTLGFDIQRPRAVILVSYVPSEIDSLPSNVGPDKVVNALASTFSSPADMIAPLARSMIAVATEVEAESTTRDSTIVLSMPHFHSRLQNEGMEYQNRPGIAGLWRRRAQLFRTRCI